VAVYAHTAKCRLSGLFRPNHDYEATKPPPTFSSTFFLFLPLNLLPAHLFGALQSLIPINSAKATCPGSLLQTLFGIIFFGSFPLGDVLMSTVGIGMTTASSGSERPNCWAVGVSSQSRRAEHCSRQNRRFSKLRGVGPTGGRDGQVRGKRRRRREKTG
jgi:hypothetical protein